MIGYTNRKNNEFYFDYIDYDLVTRYYWVLDSSGNVLTKDQDGKQLSMHKLIMGDGIYIHKNGENFDNRRHNLTDIRGYKNDGKSYLNGYIAIYKPEHPRAFDNGCVYEHYLVAEKMLNRPLKQEECVHHIDKNRTNNSEDNLMVFATNSDHIAFHGGSEAIKQDNGSYICKNKIIDYYTYVNRTKEEIDNEIEDKGSIIIIKNKNNYNICPICNNNIKHFNSLMCLDCRNKEKAKNIPLKEILENLIYDIPFEEIGRRYGVTGNTVKKWCRKYNLPSRKKDMKV